MLPIHNCIVASISVSHAYAVINGTAQQVAKCIEQSTKNHSFTKVSWCIMLEYLMHFVQHTATG